MKYLVRNSALRELIVVLFAAIIIAIPWPDVFQEIYGYPLIDRTNYINYFLNKTSVLDRKVFDSFQSYITEEFLWHFCVGNLINKIGVPIDLVFGIISFATIYVFGRIITLHVGVLGLVLLINPLVIVLAFSQLRMALAAAILGFAYLTREKRSNLSIFLAILTPFIHTASVLFLAIYAAVLSMRWIVTSMSMRWIAIKNRQLVEIIGLLLVGATVSLLIGPLREFVLTCIGDRRAVYPDVSSSFAYSFFWISLLVPLGLSYRRIRKYDYVRCTFVVLAVVVVNLTHGGYTTRFLAVFFPFIVASIFKIRSPISLPVILAFVCYAILQWLYWLRLLGGK